MRDFVGVVAKKLNKRTKTFENFAKTHLWGK